MENKNKYITTKNGMGVLISLLLGLIISTVLLVGLCMVNNAVVIGVAITSYVIIVTVICTCFAGLKVVKPNEAVIFTLFGKYYGTIVEDGYYFVNPFVANATSNNKENEATKVNFNAQGSLEIGKKNKTIPLKELTLLNEKQKVNDLDGNPIEIRVAIIWKIVDPYKAVFNVDNYETYLSTQCDGAIRSVASSFSYDSDEESDGEKTLRGSTKEIVDMLKKEIQSKVEVAGIEIIEARVAHLSYAVEIASAMLQRQQAKAIIDARKKIVEGAVTMVEMALDQLSEKEIVQLDEERKAQMVSNLLVVLCSNKDTQPIVNSGSIY
ncbi:MAG: SPFH domain-containing protein [Lachnospirales bacterium]